MTIDIYFKSVLVEIIVEILVQTHSVREYGKV